MMLNNNYVYAKSGKYYTLMAFGFVNPTARGKKMQQNKNTKPDYTVSSPIKNGEKTFWQNIGAAWKGDKGISIQLNALPITTQIMLFPYEEKREERKN